MRCIGARLCLAALLVLASGAGNAQDDAPASRAEVTVHKDDNRVTVEANMTVPVPATIAWAVLTDFAHMARYIPSLSSSEAVSEGPNVLRVTQKGAATWGPFTFDFESVRRVVLHPMSRIETTAQSGKISKMTSVSELRAVEGGVHIHYRADAEIDFWLPPLLGTAAMRHEVREQFAAMIEEMRRRAAGR
ncbi:MAG: SRPBCC family protein [Betaproteobacteria bacterium]|nr:SRPBCC family protein [Betaproteobacteria bacterium]